MINSDLFSVKSDEQCISNLILAFCVILSFFLGPKYNVFRSKNLHGERVQHCLRLGIFRFFKFLNSNFSNFKEEKINPSHKSRADRTRLGDTGLVFIEQYQRGS
jgi:hypothetical protein